MHHDHATQPTVSLLLGVHNHQPVDNWDYVLEDATEKCYRPFLEVLEAHPGVRMSVHYTGYLLNWLAENYPDLIERLRAMVQRGQVEFFTGGMYEPVLSVIPDEDKVGQIKALTQRVEELLGTVPKGLWLAERVWEPHLVKFLHEAGVDYVCLDDSHFKSVGLDTPELLGRYTSEEQGRTLDIFPISKDMRYLIPYAQPEEIMAYLKSIATEQGDNAAIYFDDGEKFGVWPGTYKTAYTEKWLDRFFTAIETNSDFVKCQLFSEYVNQSPSLGRLYLPTASYSEMLEWALPAKHMGALEKAMHEAPEEHQRFLRGGFWRHFLAKYPESNNMHKKMLRVSGKVNQLLAQNVPGATMAQDHLWRGQSNDALWHGVFGGLYLSNLRAATYKHLLIAETLADKMLQGDTFLNLERVDFDCDGQEEILIETQGQNLYLDPARGGVLFELDVRDKHFNLLDTVARRYEAYHDKLAYAVVEGEEEDTGETKSIHDRIVAKEKGLEKLLHYDTHRRASLVDHFFGPDTTLQNLFEMDYDEQGDFVEQPYDVVSAKGNQVVLERQGHVNTNGKEVPIIVQKTITVDEQAMVTTMDYAITNRGGEEAQLWFAPEFNVNLLAPEAPDRYYRVPNMPPSMAEGDEGGLATATKPVVLEDTRMVSKGELEAIPAIELVDEWLELTYQLQFNRPTTLWRFPIHTVSQSEAGFEKIYQSSVLYPNWQFTLQPDECQSFQIIQTITTQ